MNNNIDLCQKDILMAKPLEQFDESKLVNNPYTNSLLIPCTRTYSPDQCSFHPDPDNPDVGTWLPTGFYMDKVQSSRLYYSAGMKDVVYGLSDRAQRLYLYILYNLPKGKPFVQINKDNYMTRNNIKSRITYESALKELVRYGFIVKTIYRTVYWINPMMFTSGNRLKIYPNNLDVKGEL